MDNDTNNKNTVRMEQAKISHLFATVVLILYMQTLEHFAGIAQAQPDELAVGGARRDLPRGLDVKRFGVH